MKSLDILLRTIKWLPTALCFILFRPFHYYTYRYNRLMYYKSLVFVSKFFLFISGIKLSIHGTEFFPKEGKRFLIAANHQSFVDIPVILSILPCTFIQVTTPNLPGLSWHFGKMSLVIDPNSLLSVLKVINYIKYMSFNFGIPVTIFPEGKRSIDGILGKLHLGVATIAKNLDLPILPITICNSRDILPKKTLNLKSGTVSVAIHSLIEKEFIRSHSEENIIQEIKQKLQKGLDYYSATQCN